MANLKEIVTKAIIGKTKKSFQKELTVEADSAVDTVLGCWVINHNFTGQNNNGVVNVDGSYDINVWYAYDNNTKTGVLVHTFYYNETLNVKLRSETSLDEQNDIIVRALKAPSVSKVDVDGKKVILQTEKELGVEVVGNIKVRINVEEDCDDYEEEVEVETAADLVDVKVNEQYLNGVN